MCRDNNSRLGWLPRLVPGPVSLARIQAVPFGMVYKLITLTSEIFFVFNAIPLWS